MASNRVDVAANRRAAKYSGRENIRRAFWALAWPLFRMSPRFAFGWRRALLRLFGARVGKHVNVCPSAVVSMPWNLEIGEWSAVGDHALIYNLGAVKIGSRVTISQRVHLCAGTHDYTQPEMPLLKLPIRIGDDAWVCADAFVGPGVAIGEGAVVAARAVALTNVPSWTVVVGNPARRLKTRVLRAKQVESEGTA
jgi:putative colanic acid biosynthesis acetyltransferase WcaF